jgi:hypothetical protein
MAGRAARQLKLALQVLLRNLDIAQRHVGRAMTKQFHQGGQAHSGAQHGSGKCV